MHIPKSEERKRASMLPVTTLAAKRGWSTGNVPAIGIIAPNETMLTLFGESIL